jgi:nickel transport protein
MNFAKNPLALALATGLMICAPLSQAHDAWVELDGPKHEIVYGHGSKTEPFAAAKVKRVAASDAAGKTLPASLDTTGNRAVVDAKGRAAVLTVDFDNGFWSKVGDDWKNLSKADAPGATESSHSLKFGKTILAWGHGVTRPVGQRLEIVPVADAVPKVGGKLAVTVLFEGKPLAGAKVGKGGHDEGTGVSTDAKGQAVVDVEPGTQMLVVEHRLAYQGPEADKTTLAANLRFAVR